MAGSDPPAAPGAHDRGQNRGPVEATALDRGAGAETCGAERLRSPEPIEPVRRYQRERPGELVHLDVKKLGRITGFFGHRITGDHSRRRKGAGWEYVHVAIDDA